MIVELLVWSGVIFLLFGVLAGVAEWLDRRCCDRRTSRWRQDRELAGLERMLLAALERIRDLELRNAR